MKNNLKKIQYIYFRHYDENGNISPFGGATIAYIPIDSVPERLLYRTITRPFNGNVVIGISICSLQDVFCKNIGRGLAVKDAVSNIWHHSHDYMTMPELSDFAHLLFNKTIKQIYTDKIKIYERKKENLQNEIGLNNYEEMINLKIVDKA